MINIKPGQTLTINNKAHNVSDINVSEDGVARITATPLFEKSAPIILVIYAELSSDIV